VSAKKSIPSNFKAGPPAFTATTRSPETDDPPEEELDEVLLEDVELLDELEALLEEPPPDEELGPSPPHPDTNKHAASAPPNRLNALLK